MLEAADAPKPRLQPMRPAQQIVGLPDLVVEGPTMAPAQAGYDSVSWTVRNVGPGDSPSAHLRVVCVKVYAEADQTSCRDSFEWPIPPLQKGRSYAVTDPSGLRIYKYKAPGVPGATLYRMRFTATVDHNNQVREMNETNNQLTRVAENFSGPPPGAQPGVSAKPPAGVRLRPGGESVTRVVPGAKLTLATEAPWSPDKPAWVVAKNLGPVDTPEAKVEITCRTISNNPQYNNKDCSVYYQEMPGALSIPALATGKWQAFYYLAPVKGDPNSLLGGLGAALGGLPSGLRHQVRFSLQGVAGDDLVLTVE